MNVRQNGRRQWAKEIMPSGQTNHAKTDQIVGSYDPHVAYSIPVNIVDMQRINWQTKVMYYTMFWYPTLNAKESIICYGCSVNDLSTLILRTSKLNLTITDLDQVKPDNVLSTLLWAIQESRLPLYTSKIYYVISQTMIKLTLDIIISSSHIILEYLSQSARNTHSHSLTRFIFFFHSATNYYWAVFL